MADRNNSVKTVCKRKEISSAAVPEEGEENRLGYRSVGRTF